MCVCVCVCVCGGGGVEPIEKVRAYPTSFTHSFLPQAKLPMLQQKVNDESTYSNPPIGHPGLLMGNAEVWLKPRELRASRESNIVQWS